MKRALLLNSDWSPLSFVSPPRALKLMLSGRAELIYTGEKPSLWDDVYTTPTTSYGLPATLRLLQRVNRRHTATRFRKKVLFNRDDWQCQYCGVYLGQRQVTVDHVTPKSRGGVTSWKNCVTSCLPCNLKKGSKILADADMSLRRPPGEPKMSHFWCVDRTTGWHPDWSFFLGEDTYSP